MCLAVPMKIVSIDGASAEVESGGTKRKVRLETFAKPLSVGDYVIVHAGFVLNKVEESEALETIKLFDEILQLADQKA